LTLVLSGVATCGLYHAAGLASLTGDPKAATGSYLSDATGEPIGYIKTTVVPDGSIAHINDRLVP
jgi:hypothetical protein